MADALANQASLASGAGSLFDVFARAITDRLPHAPKLREVKLAKHLARHLAGLLAKHQAWAGATGAGVGIGVVLLFLAVSGRTRPASMGISPILVVMVQEADGTLAIGRPGEWWWDRGSAQLGEKMPKEQYIPSRPFPGQATPPCDTEAREEEINGGCWGQTAGTAPCNNSKLYRHGDKCYRPVRAATEKRSHVPPNTETPPLSKDR